MTGQKHVEPGPRTDEPRSNRDPAELERKLALLHEPHVAPLTAFVERLREERGGDDTVPWVDPTEAGVEARILLLLHAPGRKDVLRGDSGSPFVSADNDDHTAHNLWQLLRDARVNRGRDVVTWNAIPWYVDRKKVGKREAEEAQPALREFVELLPELEIVLLLGDDVREAWNEARIPARAVIATAPDPSPVSLNPDRRRRDELREALANARKLVRSTALPSTPVPNDQPAGVRRIEPAASLRGAIAVPGVKGISQRAVLLGALADGESRIRGFGRAGDTESAITVARAIGAEVIEDGPEELRVRGVGIRGARAPGSPIDCGNAGTVMRLTCGLLAGQSGTYELVGDESLSSRPQERVAAPLRLMGASIETTDGHAPVRIEGSPLHGINYELPVASAQVKSAILIAGLFSADGPTKVIEKHPTRDHTENMFEALGVRIQRTPKTVTVWPAERLKPLDLDIPGEFSSAAPFITAAVLLSGSELVIQGVNVSPTRAGLLDVLERMGARIGVYNRRKVGGEAVADLEVRSSPLVATRVEHEEVPRLVDELPLVALLGAFAHGTTYVNGAQELRAKETDRIETVTDALRGIGVHIKAQPDGFAIRGVPSRPRGGTVDSRGDHRIAMLGAIAGLVSREGVRVEDAECAAISFPGFYDLLASLVQSSETG